MVSSALLDPPSIIYPQRLFRDVIDDHQQRHQAELTEHRSALLCSCTETPLHHCALMLLLRYLQLASVHDSIRHGCGEVGSESEGESACQ
jgi:UDP-N-acetylglucosamine transferase subunit ALG13